MYFYTLQQLSLSMTMGTKINITGSIAEIFCPQLDQIIIMAFLKQLVWGGQNIFQGTKYFVTVPPTVYTVAMYNL